MIERTLSVHWEKLDLTQCIPNVQCFSKELSTIPQCIIKTSDIALPLVLFLSIDIGQSLGEERKYVMWDSMKKVVPFKGTYIWRGIYDVGKRFIIVLSKLGSHPVVGWTSVVYQMWFHRCWLHAFCHCHGYILYVAERLSRLLFCFHKWTI